MFKSIASFVTNAVTKYKAQHVRDVVSQYCATVDHQVVTTLPAAIEFYRGVATAIVDKTFEDPAPALQLVSAIQAVSEHYGPALRAEFDVLSTKLEERGADPAMLQRVEALFKAIEVLTTDVNDH
jgi:hypothetical protein